MKRIVLVGGGSGGHFYPLMAVAERLNSYNAQGQKLELYYIGPETYDQSALDSHGIRFIHCPSGKRRKYFSLLNYLDIFKVFSGIFVAIYKLYFLYPDVVFSKGSYTSVPVVIAAWFLRIPIVIHESDTKPGTANKLAAKLARYIAISFDDAAKFFPSTKVALTGIPIRAEFFQTVQDPLAQLGLPTDKPLIFVTGGSLGAERLNVLILETLDELLPNYTVFHQAGDAHAAGMGKTASTLITNVDLLERYFVKGTLTAAEMSLLLSAATLVVSRAGAGTIFEIAHKGKPAILIPIPEVVSHDQKTNAYAYARSGGASVLEEDNLGDGLLASEISRIMSDQQLYDKMSTAASTFAKTDAAQQIAETIKAIADEH